MDEKLEAVIEAAKANGKVGFLVGRDQVKEVRESLAALEAMFARYASIDSVDFHDPAVMVAANAVKQLLNTLQTLFTTAMMVEAARTGNVHVIDTDHSPEAMGDDAKVEVDRIKRMFEVPTAEGSDKAKDLPN